MSEMINNRDQRRAVLQSLIRQLHEGRSVDEVREQFSATFADVSAAEIAAVEQDLIREGMDPKEIQRLCDVHAAVFKGSIAEIHQPADPSERPYHPAAVFRHENRALEKLLSALDESAARLTRPDPAAAHADLTAGLERLAALDRHYSRKENLLFPFLEQHNITAPPKVMWGVDDEIRTRLRNVRRDVSAWDGTPSAGGILAEDLQALTGRIREMIFKEEHILLPMSLENLTDTEWRRIAAESPEIGFCLIEPASVPSWPEDDKPADSPDDAADFFAGQGELPAGLLRFASGLLHLDEISAVFDTLPFDITFVDADDTVRYFSQGRDRIFDRTKAIIGRKVVRCHPPASMAVVEKILADFKAGVKEHEDFWIQMGPRLILIRYYAVRGVQGRYLGTLEVTQDITPIRALSGEKRLLSE